MLAILRLACSKCPGLQAAYCYLLGQIGDALEVMPGEEFRVALQEASKVPYACQQLSCFATLPSVRPGCGSEGMYAFHAVLPACKTGVSVVV